MAPTILEQNRKDRRGEADGSLRILVYRLGSLGDTLVSLPAFHLVRERFPHAQITLLTNAPISDKAPAMASILENTGLVDDYVSYPLGMRNPRQAAGLLAAIRRKGFNLAIHLTAARGLLRSVRDYLFFRLCGIPQVLGVPFAGRDLECRLESDGENFEWEPLRLARRVERLGKIDLASDRWWDLRLSEDEQRVAAEHLLKKNLRARFIVASIGTKLDVNDWTETNWRLLFGELSHFLEDIGLVLVGSADEYDRSQRCLDAWRGAKANFCGMLSPRVSAAVLGRGCLFIGHDSGPMHLAAAVGVPCVAIFSARNLPGQWFPRGQHNTILYRKTPCFGCGLERCDNYKKACILSITVQEVAAAVRGHLLQESVETAHKVIDHRGPIN